MKINPITNASVAEIEHVVTDGSRIVPHDFSGRYSVADVLAAFSHAQERGIIVLHIVAPGGIPIYRKALKIAEGGGSK